MQYWLLKSEPAEWSWEMQLAKGDRGEPWIGKRKYQSQWLLKYLNQGGQSCFYPSGKYKEIVDVVELDLTDASNGFEHDHVSNNIRSIAVGKCTTKFTEYETGETADIISTTIFRKRMKCNTEQGRRA